MTASQQGAFAQVSDAELKRRFLDEAPRMWEEYRAFGARLQGTFATESRAQDGSGARSRIVDKHNADCKLMLYESRKFTSSSAETDAGAGVLAINRLYSFVLRRKTADSPWKVTTLQMRRDGIPPVIEKSFPSNVKPLPHLLAAYDTDLADLVHQPTFRIKRVFSVQRQGEMLVQVEFDNPPALAGDGKDSMPIRSGSLLLDPARYWCLRACEIRAVRGRTGYVHKIEYEIVGSPHQLPIPIRCAEDREYNTEGGGRAKERWVNVMDLKDQSPLPLDGEFTLSAFGLPEPPGVEWKRPTPWWLYGTALAVCLLLGGAVFRWLQIRRTRNLPGH